MDLIPYFVAELINSNGLDVIPHSFFPTESPGTYPFPNSAHYGKLGPHGLQNLIFTCDLSALSPPTVESQGKPKGRRSL